MGIPSYGTQAEVYFLRGIGTFCKPNRVAPPLSRLELLRLYQAALDNRVEWGTVDPLAVRAAVQKMIDKELKKEGKNGG